MLNSFPAAAVIGCVLGILSGLGVGGGSLLMLWLTAVMDMNHASARVINLLFFVPSAIIATVLRKRQGILKLRPLLPAIIAGCFSAALFSLIGSRLDTVLLRRLFGGLLLITGLRELFYRPRKAR